MPLQIGPTGFSLGQGEKKITQLTEVAKVDDSTGEVNEQYHDVIYLIHSASAPRLDTDGVERRELKVILDADTDSLLDKVDRVVYHLHPTFPNPIRTTRDHKRKFVLNTSAWGQFNLRADVYFKDSNTPPLTLYRYLNF
ncbi:MAG TPA: pYEATS domain-containing protein [Chloroflexia bacterium]|nr:pYEATS domain-containing protein [Chloroflexia bacterium]